MPRYILEVTYDGTQFHGSQVQGTIPTVQLALNTTLSILFRKPVETFGASRTDEGVYAVCNYFHFDTELPLDFDLLYKMNAIMPHGIAVRHLYIACNPLNNVRFNAVARLYRYKIYFHKDPFLYNRAMFFPLKMNREVLPQTASLIKEYDSFESFAKRKMQSQTFHCTIKQSYWERAGEELHYIVEANRFLRGMVRGLVATQLQVARGNISLQQMRAIIEAKDSKEAYFDVPGHGLYLEKITYPDDFMKLV